MESQKSQVTVFKKSKKKKQTIPNINSYNW